MNPIEITVLKQEDRNEVFEMLNDSEVMKFLGPRRPLNDIECEEWFLGELNTPSRFPFRELSSGELIGFCGIKIIDGENDFGYFLRRKSWGKGFGKLMCKITLQKLSEEMELKSLKIFIANNNFASKKIASSLAWEKVSVSSNESEEGFLYQVST
jgi:RimJ/RimL family protein N-acetyltransferase